MTFFGNVSTILAWTKCRLVTKHVLSSTHFHSCFFLTIPFKFYIYKKFKLSNTFMCMIIFLRIIIPSFQSHQTRLLSTGLGMALNRYRLSCNGLNPPPSPSSNLSQEKKWPHISNDSLLQANDGKVLVNDGEMLVNDREMLVVNGEMSVRSYTIRSFHHID